MGDIDLKSHLLSTAARLFQQQGYAAVSLRKIAAAAGVTTGSLYYYFSDKDEVVHEILDSGHRRTLAEVRRAVEALGPSADRAAKVRAGIRAHLGVLFEDDSFPAANVRIFAHVPAHLRAAVRSGRHAYEQYWVDLLTVDDDRARHRIEPRQLTMFLFGATNWTLEWYKAKRDSLEDLADALAQLFFEATLAQPPAPKAVRQPGARSARGNGKRTAA